VISAASFVVPLKGASPAASFHCVSTAMNFRFIGAVATRMTRARSTTAIEGAEAKRFASCLRAGSAVTDVSGGAQFCCRWVSRSFSLRALTSHGLLANEPLDPLAKAHELNVARR
jgi:hypothetical protein